MQNLALLRLAQDLESVKLLCCRSKGGGGIRTRRSDRVFPQNIGIVPAQKRMTEPDKLRGILPDIAVLPLLHQIV